MPRTNRRRTVLAVAMLAAVVMTILAATAAGTPRARNGQIAFRRFFDGGNTTGAVFLTNPDGSGSRQITQPPEGGLDDQPNWAPDGSRILFTRQLSPDNPDGGAFWTVNRMAATRSCCLRVARRGRRSAWRTSRRTRRCTRRTAS